MTRPTGRAGLGVTVIAAFFAALVPLDRYLTEVAMVVSGQWRIFLGVVILAFVAGRRARPPFAPVWVLSGVLIPLGGIVSGQTTSISASLSVAVELTLLVGLTPWVLAYYLGRSRRFARVVLGSFLASQCVSAGLALAQLVGLRPLGIEPIFGRSLGLAAHANVLGFMSFLAVMVCLAWLQDDARRVKAVVPVVLGLVNIGSLVASGSVSALSCLAIAIVVYAWTTRRAIRLTLWALPTFSMVVLATTLLGLGAGFVIDPVVNRIDVITGTSDIEGGAASVGTRILTYEWAWEHITQSPLVGVGMDNTFAGTYNGYTPVHNFVLHAWYQGGFFFMVWSALAVGAVLLTVARCVAAGRSAVVAGGLAGTMFFALTSAFYAQPQYWLPVLFLVATLGAKPGEEVRAGAARPARSRAGTYDGTPRRRAATGR